MILKRRGKRRENMKAILIRSQSCINHLYVLLMWSVTLFLSLHIPICFCWLVSAAFPGNCSEKPEHEWQSYILNQGNKDKWVHYMVSNELVKQCQRTDLECRTVYSSHDAQWQSTHQNSNNVSAYFQEVCKL